MTTQELIHVVNRLDCVGCLLIYWLRKKDQQWLTQVHDFNAWQCACEAGHLANQIMAIAESQ